jgi:hypothetical protein
VTMASFFVFARVRRMASSRSASGISTVIFIFSPIHCQAERHRATP